ncbi:uroporphyrinogen-III C-methyltransferase [Rothia nasimurium]|uniref:uroporphyrinogen-III C-methyltransferase n=1 Tax=Rothia nasimurium TaxID=85336 RepID=A0A4Y9F8B9_9MICC|nr:uroporphyrinogen-III C-methyltransferase [Rothia nasimurium]MBF0807217.1 uroporphyrinogen-III C-methyltransferase [Rothia nasimurium]TFU24194.1 uroporphyrinogen-III C-methyltransferase [Rothia nasimurium]
MFTDHDVTSAAVMLCGASERVGQVVPKYKAAAEVMSVYSADLLPSVLEDISPSVVVICAEQPEEIGNWRQAVKSALGSRGLYALLLVDSEPAPQQVGRVFLIGAGPGDPGLMTRHALEALSRADVVLLDHLAPHQDLPRWAPKADIIDVGKIPGQHRVPQRKIDRLMVEHALAGRTVARLKGGDPYVFGRGAEELYVCEQSGIPVTVYSGVTSSIALPALAGVPITLRGVSHMFTVVSGHAPLGSSELDQLAGLLKDERGVPASLPLIAVQDGFRPNQREVYATLGDCLETLADVKPPAVITLGEVCAVAGPRREEVMAKAFETH